MPFAFYETLLLWISRVGSSFRDEFVIPPGEPLAEAYATVVQGNARFTVLTAHTLRLEYSPTGAFEDRQTFVVWNRKLPLPPFQSWYSHDGKLIIDTGSLQLQYSNGPFTDETLSIKMMERNLLDVDTWKPGMSTEGNLYGTFRAYDGLEGLQNLNCTQQQGWEMNNESAHCTFGLISRAGWATFSDARSPVFSNGWIQPQTNGLCPASVSSSNVPCLGSNSQAKAKVFNEAQCVTAGCCWIGQSGEPACVQRQGNIDLYFFGHGVGKGNYRQALFDFTQIAGKVPMPRRHVLGVSWSRWGYGAWNGNQTLQMDAVQRLNSSGFPLDTFILDMNWHDAPDFSLWEGGVRSWPANRTGYTWNKTAYPDSEAFLKYLHGVGLQVGANIHDAQGVRPQEIQYSEMAKANKVADGQVVPFHISDRTFAGSLHTLILGPLAAGDVPEGAGFDFWWTDWQQGLEGDPGIGTVDISGLNPTAWLNHYRYLNYTGSSRRGQILSRFGGLGGHRYPSQFAGDIVQGWASLEAMVYTNAIAANVLVAYWAQEIMQHEASHELFTRVIQMGAWSPVFAMFGNPVAPCNVWDDTDFPQPFRSAAREALVQRAMLLPYRYTLAYQTHKTGLAMVRPMYYDYPFHDEAYSGNYSSLPQYFLGDLLAAPVTKAMDGSGAASVPLWLPEDKAWYRLFANSPQPEANKGWTSVTASLDQVPVYAPAGAVLPMRPRFHAVGIGSASHAFDPLEWLVLPGGAPEGASWCYEDDGLSNDYLLNSNVNLTISWNPSQSSPELCTNWYFSASGDYNGAPNASSRQYFLRLLGFSSVVASQDGVPVIQNGLCNHSSSRVLMTPGSWCYGPKGSSYTADDYVLIALKAGKIQHHLFICTSAPSHNGGWPVLGYVLTAGIFVVIGIGYFLIKRKCASRARNAVHVLPRQQVAERLEVSLQGADSLLPEGGASS